MLQHEVYSCCCFLLDISAEDVVFGFVKLLISKVPEGCCDNMDADRENFTFWPRTGHGIGLYVTSQCFVA